MKNMKNSQTINDLILYIAKDVKMTEIELVLKFYYNSLINNKKESFLNEYNIYFVGETLSIDFKYLENKVIVLINARTETISILANGETIKTRLCSLAILKYYMLIYYKEKGITEYLSDVIRYGVLDSYLRIPKEMNVLDFFEPMYMK
jgi:tryptophan synthase alpha subunit